MNEFVNALPRKPQHIVLPEGNDPRTVIAAAMCARNRLARITLLGDEATIRETAQREGADLGGVTVIDHRRAPDFEKMASLFHEMRRAKGLMADEARTLMTDPLYYGNLMVRLEKPTARLPAQPTLLRIPCARRFTASACVPDSNLYRVFF